MPYCCGYSKVWKPGNMTVFIDPGVPRNFKLSSGNCDVYRYAAVHESVEKTLMEVLGMRYEPAHAIATAAEEAAVKADGHDVAEYNKAWNTTIDEVGGRKSYPRISPELDTEPYRDENDITRESEMGLMKHA